MSRVWPVRRSSWTESIVVSVSIHEIAYTVLQEAIHGFQQTLLEIAAMLNSNWSYFSAPLYMKEFFAEWYNLVPLIRQLSVTPYTHACLKRVYMGFFVRMYMRVCKKMVIYLGIKTPQSRKERKYTWQKNACISCSRNDCKYTWEKTARTSCPNLETNRRP